MGILNVTPDSFSDGGLHGSVGAAVRRAEEMVAEGVDLIDVGGESTRPGADEIPLDTELERVVPVVERIAHLGVEISIDSRKAPVAAAALDAGAGIVNDVSGGTHDPELLGLVADRGVPVVLMHMRGTPKTMDREAGYENVVAGVRAELTERLEAAEAAGVDRSQVLLDPGLGFAKNAEQSLELLASIDELGALGCPLVVGPSRKRFVGHVLGTEVGERLEGTLAAAAWCAMHGVAVVRVHDVLAARRTVDMIAAIAQRRSGGTDGS